MRNTHFARGSARKSRLRRRSDARRIREKMSRTGQSLSPRSRNHLPGSLLVVGPFEVDLLEPEFLGDRREFLLDFKHVRGPAIRSVFQAR